MRLHPWGWGTSHPEGTSDCADEVTLSRKGAKSQQHVRGLRSTGTKARTHVERLRATNADLKKKLDEALEQQTATSDVLRVISGSPNALEPVFQAMLANATRICDANLGLIFRREGDAFRVVSLHGAPPALADERRRNPVFHPSPGTALGRAAATKQTVQIADVQAEPGYSHATPGLGSTAGIATLAGARTVVAVPMLKEDEMVGAIVIYRQEVRPFTDKQIELVTNFAAQAVIAIENTRLLNELRESLQQQTASADVLKAISRSTFDLQAVLDTLVESAGKLCQADSVALRIAKDGLYRHAASYGLLPEHKARMVREPIRPDQAMVGQVLSAGKSVHILDTQADANRDIAALATRGGVHTMLGVPLLREGTPIGVLLLQRRYVQPFTDKQIELVETFADQAVIAIENARLFDEVQARTRDLSEALEQQTATSEVLQVISSSPGELEPVFQAMLANATRICEASYGTLWLCEGGGFRAVALHGALPSAFTEQLRDGRIWHPSEAVAITRVARTLQTVQVDDLSADQGYLDRAPLYVAAVELAGIRTLVVVPMLKESEMVGAIAIYRREVRPFTDKQIALVQNFAAQAVIAIENTRLLNELRQRTDDLSKSLEQQTATSSVLRVISTSPGKLEPVFEALLANAVRVIGSTFGTMYLRQGDLFRVGAVHGAPPAYVETLKSEPLFRPGAETVLGRVARTKQVMHVPNLLVDEAYRKRGPRVVAAVEQGGVQALLSVPMLKDNELVGTITIYRAQTGSFTDKQIELIQNFAAQAVIAIENTRLLNELRQRTMI